MLEATAARDTRDAARVCASGDKASARCVAARLGGANGLDGDTLGGSVTGMGATAVGAGAGSGAAYHPEGLRWRLGRSGREVEAFSELLPSGRNGVRTLAGDARSEEGELGSSDCVFAGGVGGGPCMIQS